MAPLLLPISLSPHVCIVSSPDLSSLLESSSLPPLPQILQSFSPLPNVTTRSTSLTTIPHSSFALRFSDLLEIETACREDDDQRAVRTIDWIGARVDKRCAKWVQDVENTPEKEWLRTPWWDELRHCAEGDHVPSKTEGWNHPVSVILAVSTLSANPLQSITSLHSRELDFPSWVDSAVFRYTLIIHPKNSPLSNQEAGALFNAVKKQFGLHSYLLPLELPSPPPPQRPVPTLLPRLPLPEQEDKSSPSSASGASHPQGVNTLKLSEGDIQQTSKFTREFVVMSLVPWMEKCVLEWNETFSSTRRLPSRLFSSTRRLFGSPSPSPAPTNNLSSSATSLPRSSFSTSTGRSDMTVPPPSQQRRLAEFATILGDYKMAIAVLESLRKDGKPAADVLPMLLSPSPAIPTYVLNALSNIHPSPTQSPPKAQLRALIAAVRWEAGIPTSDFLGDALGGERWLVWAAGDAEETTSALLLAHAASLCARKGSNRRAAFYYLMAANKLEKVGIKPLTMHFLRKAHELYTTKPQKLLSPSFWDSEYQSLDTASYFDAILSGIGHPLGRLLYTTGDIAGAVKLFVGLLRGSNVHGQSTNDKAASGGQEVTATSMFLEDFQVALDHLKSTVNDTSLLAQLKLPTQFCIPRDTRLRLSGGHSKHSDDVWEVREEAWLQFRRENGNNEQLEKSGKAVVGETFWIDLVLQNPLDTEINLSNFTAVVQEETGTSSSEAPAQTEVINQVVLAAKEKKKISLSIKPLKPTALIFHQVTFNFLSLLPTSEPLSYQGQRLHNTPAQRQVATYAPDTHFVLDVVEAHHRLTADFSDEQISLLQGEYGDLRIWLSNTGINPITELWVVVGACDELWFNEPQDEFKKGVSESEILLSPNSIKPDVVYRVPNIATDESPFQPGENKEIFLKFRAETPGRRELCFLLTYRQGGDTPFQSIRLSKEYEVQELFELGASTRPCESMEHIYTINLEITNNHPSDAVELLQVSTLSPTWKCTSLKQENISLYSSQSSRILIAASPWTGGTGARETLEYVAASLGDILSVSDVQETRLPPIEVLCNHVHKTEGSFSVQHPMIQQLIQRERQHITAQHLIPSFPQIPARLHSSVFPLYNPFAIDILVFWTIPSKSRLGHVMVSGLTLGARHAPLKEMIEAAENTKASRSMYAETQRERAELLNTVRNSDWNVDMNPLSITVQNQGNVVHDFSKGPCIVNIPIVVRNYSMTHTAKFVLRFPSPQDRPSAMSVPYMGRTSFRGTLEPRQSTIVRPKLWLTQPGTYSIDSWTLSAEMLTTSKLDTSSPRHYTRQSSPTEMAQLIISDIQST